LYRTCVCNTAQYNCTTQDPNQICANTCDCPNTSIGGPCIITDCYC
jgi:hypothetical protein